MLVVMVSNSAIHFKIMTAGDNPNDPVHDWAVKIKGLSYLREGKYDKGKALTEVKRLRGQTDTYREVLKER